MDIPLDADIGWYKEKIKTYPNVKKIADLIREDKLRFKFIHPYKDKKSNDEKEFDNMNSFEIIENLTLLCCGDIGLTSLPPMPKLEELRCSYNQLTSLPLMPNLTELNCHDNQLTSLSSYPNLKYLDCYNNRLTFLPPMPNLIELDCRNNSLPFTSIKKWINYWKLNI